MKDQNQNPNLPIPTGPAPSSTVKVPVDRRRSLYLSQNKSMTYSIVTLETETGIAVLLYLC
jgi:hypothetical protein